MVRVSTAVERNENRLEEQDRREAIALEWKQLALVCDRFLFTLAFHFIYFLFKMFFFVFLCEYVRHILLLFVRKQDPLAHVRYHHNCCHVCRAHVFPLRSVTRQQTRSNCFLSKMLLLLYCWSLNWFKGKKKKKTGSFLCVNETDLCCRSQLFERGHFFCMSILICWNPSIEKLHKTQAGIPCYMIWSECTNSTRLLLESIAPLLEHRSVRFWKNNWWVELLRSAMTTVETTV